MNKLTEIQDFHRNLHVGCCKNVSRIAGISPNNQQGDGEKRKIDRARAREIMRCQNVDESIIENNKNENLHLFIAHLVHSR